MRYMQGKLAQLVRRALSISHWIELEFTPEAPQLTPRQLHPPRHESLGADERGTSR
jgi:hypothetical protein